MLKKEINISFIGKCDFKNVTPYKCILSEGISVPFRAVVTLFSKDALKRNSLNGCLNVKTEITLLQYNTAGSISRGRRFQGIITSYRSLGLVSSLGSTASGDDCYCYELTIEPEMVLMGLNRRTRRFSSDSTPTDVISEIFASYQQNCEISSSMFDRIPENGYILQQNNESDLSFINRICRNFGFNYVFELTPAEDDSSKSSVKVVFSRGWKTGHAKQLTGNSTLVNKETIVCAVGRGNAESFDAEPVYLERMISSGYIGKGSIYTGENSATTLRADSIINSEYQIQHEGFDHVKGLAAPLKKSMSDYISESQAALSNVSSDRIRITSHDFAVAAGQILEIDGESYLVIRSHFGFNLDYPAAFKQAVGFETKEHELDLTAVAIPKPENEESTLAPLCTLGGINADDADSAEKDTVTVNAPSTVLAGTNNTVRESGSSSVPSVFIATVCDKDGAVTSIGTIQPSSDDNTAFPSSFYALLNDANQTVTATYVSTSSGDDSLGNFPRIGQKVLLILVNGSYYFQGYLPTTEALPVFDSSMRNELIFSRHLCANNLTKTINNGNRDSDDNILDFTQLSSTKNLIKHMVNTGKITSFMNIVGTKFSSQKIIDTYTSSHKSNLETNLKNIIDAKNKLDGDLKAARSGSQTSTDDDIQKLKDLYTSQDGYVDDLIGAIKTDAVISSALKKIIKNDTNISEYKDDQLTESQLKDKQMDLALQKALVPCGSILFTTGCSRIYAKGHEIYADADTSVLSNNVTVKAQNNLILTADKSITLQVGNSKLNINGNTIQMAVAYFTNKFSPWDASVSLSPTTGVTVSGFQFKANSLTSSAISDSFGGGFSTKYGQVTSNGVRLKSATLSAPAVLKTAAGLGAKVLNGAFSTGWTDSNSEGWMVSSSCVKAANSITSIIADIIATIILYNKDTNRYCKTRSVYNAVIAGIGLALDAVDMIENLVTNIILAENDNDISFCKRTKENNYISPHDIYLMVSSSARMVTSLASYTPLAADNLKSMKSASSMELSATNIAFGAKTTTNTSQIDQKSNSPVSDVSQTQVIDQKIKEGEDEDSEIDNQDD